MIIYGILKRLNLYVAVGEDESMAARKSIDDQQQEDGKSYLVDKPPYSLLTKRIRNPRLHGFRDLMLLVGNVFDFEPGRYGGSTLLRGDNAIALRSILRRENENRGRVVKGSRIIARIETMRTARFQYGTTRVKAHKWIVAVDEGGIGVCRALR